MLYPLRLGAQDRRVDPCPAALCAAASWHREDQPARSAFPPPRRAIEGLDLNKEASNTCFVRTRHRSCGSPARARRLAPGPVQIAAFSPRRRKPAELSDPLSPNTLRRERWRLSHRSIISTTKKLDYFMLSSFLVHSRSGPSRVSPVARGYPASRPPAMRSDIRTADWRSESFARCA